MRKILSVLLLFVSSATLIQAQTGENYEYLKKYILAQPKLKIDSSNFLSIYHNKELHYLYPLYKSITQENRLIANANSTQYLIDLSEAVSFNGDYLSALEIEKKSYDSKLEDSLFKSLNKQADLFSGIEFKDAKKYILEKAKNQKVVMLNESHNKPLHRAFTASLLEELYTQGFRYLAMETLNPFTNASLKQENILTGHYTCEPIGGELVRHALNLGFKLVAYDDTSYTHTVNQREYTQAENIHQILQKDPSAKIIVLAGDKHIEEGATSDDRIPMAAYFKIVSGIDPLTIDQTSLTEQSTSEYGSAIYANYATKNTFPTPVVLLKNNHPKDIFDLNLCDIYILHPPTKYRNGRPTWTSMNGLKKETAVQPIYQTLFFVQAFYDKEYNEKLLGKLVPADQTYITAPDGYYYLYLQKGRYQIAYRDMQYKLLGTKVLVVE
jgi:hypothetical protein